MGIATIWFAVGGLVAAIAYLLNAHLAVQIILFLVVSIGLLIFTRPLLNKYLQVGKVKTNVESLIGEKCKVITKISNLDNQGNVKVGGQEWSARSDDDNVLIDVDKIVYIKAVEGVKLIVSEKE